MSKVFLTAFQKRKILIVFFFHFDAQKDGFGIFKWSARRRSFIASGSGKANE
jgi:hypothetical protein